MKFTLKAYQSEAVDDVLETLERARAAYRSDGTNSSVELSAKTGLGVDNLLSAISIQAEVLEVRAVATGRATGVFIESALDKGRGPVATVLVQQGELKKGDYLVCGVQYGRVRALFDETGALVESHVFHASSWNESRHGPRARALASSNVHSSSINDL